MGRPSNAMEDEFREGERNIEGDMVDLEKFFPKKAPKEVMPLRAFDLFVPGTDKKVGNYDPQTKVFTRLVTYQKHHLHRVGAWAVNETTISSLDNLNCKTLKIIDKLTLVVWTIPFKHFKENSFDISFDIDRQRACPDKHWIRIDPKQGSLFSEDTNG